MVLAAGLGTRLRPLTDELPKALVPVGDMPLLGQIFARLARGGVTQVVLNTHHLPLAFESLVRAAPLSVQVINEPSLLGTAGALANARSFLGTGTVIVYNADILVEFNLDALLAGTHDGAPCLMVAEARAKGTVGVDASNCVARLRGERFGEVIRETDYVGVMALPAALISELPAQGCLVGDYLLPRLRRAESVRTVPARGAWCDVGSLASYWQANMSWLERTVGVGASWCGPGASLGENVRLRSSLIGANAKVVGSGELRDCVVWPGATVRAPLQRAIVTTAGNVVPC